MSSSVKDQSSGSMDFPFRIEDVDMSGSMGSFASIDGKEFANTVSYISRGEYIPERKKYPAFRKIFYEEVGYNPPIESSNDQAFVYHEKEQEKYWQRKGIVFSTQERFVEDKGYNCRGPVKAAEYPHLFERGEKYFGRERKLLPYLRAQLYTRPVHTANEELRKSAVAPPTIGPQTYDLGDYWQPKLYSTVGPKRRPSPCMASTTQRDVLRECDGSSQVKREAKKTLMRPLLSSAPATLENAPKSQSTKETPQLLPPTTSHMRPRTPGGVLRRAVDDPFCLQGRTDYHFVRVQQKDGRNYILPVSNEDGSPIDSQSPSKGAFPSDSPPQFSVVETWGRPHSRSKRIAGNLLRVESFSLQKCSESRDNDDIPNAHQLPSPTSCPKSSGRESSLQTSTDRLASPKGMCAPKRCQELLVSPVGKQRASTSKNIISRRRTPTEVRSGAKQFLNHSSTVRSLSLDQKVRERKFAEHVNPNQKIPAKVKLCVSDHVAVVPSVVNLESTELTAGNSSDFLNKASERSQVILDNFNWGDSEV